MKKIRIGIIGGSVNSTIGSTHIKALRATGKFKIVAGIFSNNTKSNRKSVKEYSLDNFKNFIDINKFINYAKKIKLDFVLIITPPQNREKIYKKLIDNNINIISEKPISNNYFEIKKLEKYYNKKKLLFFSTYNYLFYPAILEIKDRIKKIGRIIHFNIEINQDSFASKKINKIKKWRLKDDKVPNLFLDLSSHTISILIFLFSKLPYQILSWSNKNNNKTIDNNYTLVRLKKFYGKISVNKNSLGKKNDFIIQIFCEKGSIVWSHKYPERIILTDKFNTTKIIDRDNYKIGNKEKLFTYKVGHPNGFLESFINLYNSIYNYYFMKKDKTKPLINFKKNLTIMKILESMKISDFNKNKWVKIKY